MNLQAQYSGMDRRDLQEELGIARGWMNIYAREARSTKRGQFRSQKVGMALECRARREYLKSVLAA